MEEERERKRIREVERKEFAFQLKRKPEGRGGREEKREEEEKVGEEKKEEKRELDWQKKKKR